MFNIKVYSSWPRRKLWLATWANSLLFLLGYRCPFLNINGCPLPLQANAPSVDSIRKVSLCSPAPCSPLPGEQQRCLAKVVPLLIMVKVGRRHLATPAPPPLPPAIARRAAEASCKAGSITRCLWWWCSPHDGECGEIWRTTSSDGQRSCPLSPHQALLVLRCYTVKPGGPQGYTLLTTA